MREKLRVSRAWLGVAAQLCALQGVASDDPGMASIKEASLRGHVSFLASDDMAGRDSLSPEGRIAAEGSPAKVLGSEAAARAFGVKIRGHAVPGLDHLLYMFEEGP